MENIERNSPMDIQNTLNQPEYAKIKLSKLLLSIKLTAKTLIYGRKWIVYLLLSLLPIMFSLFGPDKLLGDATGSEAFVNQFMDIIMLLLFAFGALLICLPFTADEITDNIMEGYVVRPVDREILYTARWIVGILGIWIINSIIATAYYFYFQYFDLDAYSVVLYDDLWILGYLVLLLFLTSLMYGSIFVLIGVIGNRGFTFGVIVAVVETFFISLLFLANSRYIPRTHVENMAAEFLSSVYPYSNAPDGLTLFDNLVYVFIFSLIFYLIGLYYFREREFNE